MKRIIGLVLILFVFGMVNVGVDNVRAENLESMVVDVSSMPATGDSYIPGHANFALVIGSHVPKSLISRITITSDDLSVAQTVTFWENWTNGTSSAAVTKIWELDLDAVTSVGPEIFQEYFGDGDRAYLKADNGLYISKTLNESGITVSFQYK